MVKGLEKDVIITDVGKPKINHNMKYIEVIAYTEKQTEYGTKKFSTVLFKFDSLLKAYKKYDLLNAICIRENN